MQIKSSKNKTWKKPHLAESAFNWPTLQSCIRPLPETHLCTWCTWYIKDILYHTYVSYTYHTSPITYYIISYILSQLSRITLHTSHILCECIARINTENLALGTLERRANNFIIQCIFSSFSLVGSPSRDLQITQCLQIIVCSCAIPSNCVLLQITFFSFIMVTTPLCKTWQMPENCFNNLGARMIKQLFNSDIAKILWFGSVFHISYLPRPFASGNNWNCLTSADNC